jgi:hypothetical protein
VADFADYLAARRAALEEDQPPEGKR